MNSTMKIQPQDNSPQSNSVLYAENDNQLYQNEEQPDQIPMIQSGVSSLNEVVQNAHLQQGQICGPHPCRRQEKLQILYWIAVALLVIVITYFLHDNQVQEKEIIFIHKRVEQFNNINSGALSLEQKEQFKKVAGQIHQDFGVNASINIKNVEEKVAHQQVKLKSYLFDEIPRRVWYYATKNMTVSSLWTKKCYEQHRRIAKNSGHEFIATDVTDYGRYITKERFQLVEATIANINARYQARQQPQIIKYRESIIKQIIMLEVLIENGGIFVDEDIILTQNLTWIDNIYNNNFVNARKWLKKALIVAFHSVEYSSKIQRYSHIDTSIQTEKYIVLFPSISPYFFAAVKKNQFLKDLRDLYYKLLKDPKSLQTQLMEELIELYIPRTDIRYYQYLFEISCQLTLRAKQKDLLPQSEALKYYQLATINQNYGPTKIKAYLTEEPINKIFNHLAFMTRQELQYEFGSMRYMLRLEPKQQFYVQLLQQMEKKLIIANSLIDQAFFQPTDDSFALKVPRQVVKTERWDSLPAKLWVYLDLNSYELELLDQIWLQNIKLVCEQSGFELIILSESNLAKYLSEEVINRISEASNHKTAKLNVYPETKKQLVSLAVLYEHGGVWLNSQTHLIGNLQWLININQEPFLWNKHGSLPKVVLSFHPHYGSPFEWTYNRQGTKQSWHLAYQNNFIAAQPRAALIKDWLDQYIIDLSTSIQELFQKFYVCKMSYHKWITDFQHEMLSQDCIKCVLGAKKVKLVSEGSTITPNEYYGLWAINGFAGNLKMREYTNFIAGRNMKNPFLWRHSSEQVQKIIGKINHIVTIYGTTAVLIQSSYGSYFKDTKKEFHKDSFFMNWLSRINGTVVKSDNRLFLQTQLKQKQSLQQKEGSGALSNVLQTVWIYEGGQIDPNDNFMINVYNNIEHYAKMSGFQVRYVNRHNFDAWLTSQNNASIKRFLEQLQLKLNNEKSNLKDHFENIVAQIITLSIMYRLGGISITRKLILHQKLDWIKEVQKIQFINKGGHSQPKVFAFFSPGYSPKKISNNTKQGFYQYPSLQSSFIASGKKSPFLKDFIQQFKEVVLQKQKNKQKIRSLGYGSGWLHGDDPYYEAIFLASQFTLNKKHKELLSNNSKLSAIDYYGLYTLNSRFFSWKLNNFFNILLVNLQNTHQYLGRTPLSELERQVGTLKYLSLIPKYEDLKKCIGKAADGQKGYQIMEGSFLHQHLVLDSQQRGIFKYQNISNAPKGKQWGALPQDVWIYTQKGIKQTNLMAQVMFAHLNVSFAKAGFNVHEVTDANIKQYVDKNLLEKFNKIISSKNNQVHKQYAYKLLLLLQNGGITVNLNLLVIQSLSWVKKIGHFQKELVFNRFAANPKVFMFIDTLRSPINKWNYSKDTGKVGHVMGWTDDLIAAQKSNQLIKQWVEALLNYLSGDSKAQLKIFEDCQLKESQRSKSDSAWVRLDVLQCVLNRRHIKLVQEKSKKQVGDYYKLWGLSEYLGVAKLQEQLDLDKLEDDLNPFIWMWDQQQAETFVGKFNLMARLTSKQILSIENLINKNKLKQWGNSESLLVRTLYSSVKDHLHEKNGKIMIKL